MDPLQKIGHKDSAYERPGEKWECGLKADGHACTLGPDPGGRCTAHGQTHCEPRVEHDRATCTRPAAFGGKCKQGPLADGTCSEPNRPPCRPRLSWRARRGRLVLWSGAGTAAALLLALLGPWQLHVISPGPLVAAHAGIPVPDGAVANCAACHDAVRPVPSATDAPIAAGPDVGVTRCLDCHFADRAPALARAAHSINPGILDDVRARLVASPAPGGPGLLSAAALRMGPEPDAELLCSTCHVEHQGREHDLTAIGDLACQSCHVQPFGAFGRDHPAFRSSDARTTGIGFNHASHQSTHYEAQEFTCAQCHTVEPERGTVMLAPFETSCAACHYQGEPDHHGARIRAGEIVLLELPYVDFEGGPEPWPLDAAQGERLPPLMRTLLAGDPEARPALDDLFAEDLEWIAEDWYPDDPELKHALAAAILGLATDLSAPNPAGLRARLSRGLGLANDDPRIEALTAQLVSSRFAVSVFLRRWLPADPDVLPDPATDFTAGADTPAAGWYADDAAIRVAYRPAGHADPFLRRWTEALGAPAGATADTDAGAGLVDRLRQDALAELQTDAAGGVLYASCLRCHLGSPGTGPLAGDWAPQGHSTADVGFGRFDHRSHVPLRPGQDGCATCHVVESGPVEPPAARVAGFDEYTVAQCATCHVDDRAPTTCLTCHDYHITRP